MSQGARFDARRGARQDDIPRRIQMQKWCEAERLIQGAVDEVERMGADVRLTDAVVLLAAARDRVADFVDGVEGKRTVPSGVPAPQGDAPPPSDLASFAARRANFHATYNGGWHGNADGMRAFHHGMDTVFNALDKEVARGAASSSGSSPLRERPLSPADLPLTFGMPKEPGDDMGGQST